MLIQPIDAPTRPSAPALSACSGLAPDLRKIVTKDAVGRTLAGMIGCGHGVDAICFFLTLTLDELRELLVEFDLPATHEKPFRRGGGAKGWTSGDYAILIECWIENWRAAAIADRLGRSKGSIYYKSRFLGLPKRDRRALLTPDADLVATRASTQASLAPARLTSEHKSGPASADEETWLIQGASENIEMRWKRRGIEVLGSEPFHRFVAMQKWSGVRNAKIAAMCRVSQKVIDNVVMRMGIPRLPREQRSADYDADLALRNIQALRYEEARDKGTCLYWRRRGSWSLSHRDRKRVDYRFA